VVPVAAVLLALVAGIATMLGGGSGGGATAGVVIRPDSVAAIDPRSGRVLADFAIPVGTAPAPLVYADGFLWTYNRNQRSLIRLDPKTGREQVEPIVVAPTDLAVGGGYEWVAGGVDNRIYRYQWESRTLDPIDLPRMRGTPDASSGEGPSEIGQVAVHGSEVFATAQGIDWPQTIAVYNTSTLDRNHVYRLPIRSRQIGDIEAGSAGVWMENRIQRLNGEEKAALASVFPHLGPPLYVLQGQYLQQGVAVASQSVWFAPGRGQTVIDLNPATNERFAVVTPADPVTAVAAGGAGIWAAASRLGALFELDPTRHAVTLTVHLPRTSAAYITGLAVGRNRVWALIQSSDIQPGWPCPTPTCYLP
jgi:streptogramin lyase